MASGGGTVRCATLAGMRRLAAATELLDGPLDARLLAGNLRDLARVNAWLGGNALSWRAVEPLLDEGDEGVLRLLDVGTGGADLPRDLIRRATAHGGRLEIVATDVRPEIVHLALKTRPLPDELTIELARSGTIDAEDGAFDVAHASLVLHHLEPDAARALLREMARVARSAVIVNDLARGRLWLLGARALSLVATRNLYTRNDAPLSVRRAYSIGQLTQLAAHAGLRPVARYRAVPPYRFALVFKHDGPTRGRVSHDS